MIAWMLGLLVLMRIIFAERGQDRERQADAALGDDRRSFDAIPISRQ